MPYVILLAATCDNRGAVARMGSNRPFPGKGMRVALVTEWLDSWRGGAETSTRQFMHHLMDAGVELHVYTRSRPSPVPGLFVHSIPGAAMSRMRKSLNFGLRADRLIREENFDLVHTFVPIRHAHVYQPRGGSVPETIERNVALRRHAAARRLKRCVNRFNFKQRYMARMERTMLEGPQRPTVVAISRYVARQYEQHYRMAPDRIRLIYNGVDQDALRSHQKEQERATLRREFNIGGQDLLVLEVAHNFRLKGVQHWMQALARLRDRGVHNLRSLVVGRGDAPRWHHRAHKLGLNGSLEFVGPSERVRQFYHAADMLVHPTYYDPCSRVVLEAMSTGLPCVTSRWDGAAEIIKDGESGFVIDEPDDVPGMIDRVARLFDAGRRVRMGEAARQAVQPFSMARHAAEMLQLYEEIARTRVSA
jgi:UDP-glucose:(heptosyl)LPS alpha-1,3-glucosyltransferase